MAYQQTWQTNATRGFKLLALQASTLPYEDHPDCPADDLGEGVSREGWSEIENILPQIVAAHQDTGDYIRGQMPCADRLATVFYSTAEGEDLASALQAVTFASWICSEPTAVRFLRKLTLTLLVEAGSRLSAPAQNGE